MRRKKKVFSSKTGTGASIVDHKRRLFRGHMVFKPVMAKLVLSYGATPTITVYLQGSNDSGASWDNLANGTWTTGTPKYLHAPAGRRYDQYRLNITDNTNVTVTEAFIGVGRVED